MTFYVLRRLALAAPTLLLVSVVVFAGVRLAPGDPAVTLAGQNATQDVVEAIRRDLGLDQPLPVQYLRYISGVLRLDLGNSMVSRAPVSDEVLPRYPVTIMLALSSTLLALLLGIAAGMVAAARHRTRTDYVTMSLSLLGLSVPNFVLALVLILIFAVQLQVLPATGSSSALHYVLPTVTLALPAAAVVARMTRSSLLDVLGEEYVRTARSKGLDERTVLMRHALGNALIPVVTIAGQQLAVLMAGAVIVESMFGLPGIGKLLVDSILDRDYSVVQGVVLLAASGFVLTNLAVDVLYAFIDPRIRYS